MMLAPYSAGRLFGRRTDTANQTPREFAVLQNVSISDKYTTKSIQGKNQLALFIARGEEKLTLKVEIGVFSCKLFNDIFFGQSVVTGSVPLAADEPHTVPATTPFTVTATNSATFLTDEGVAYAASGNQLTFSTGAPSAIGQYEQAAGTYTFSSSDASAAILLNYLYTTTAGEQIAIANMPMGNTPYFTGVFRNKDPNSGLFVTRTFNRLMSSSLTMDAKMGDWQLANFEIEAMDDGAGQIGTMSFGDTN
jgi:hypothetical protein